MKNIQRLKLYFQSVKDSTIYIFLFCFDLIPEVKPRPFICLDSPYERKVKKLTEAVRAFNLKKSGGEAK